MANLGYIFFPKGSHTEGGPYASALCGPRYLALVQKKLEGLLQLWARLSVIQAREIIFSAVRQQFNFGKTEPGRIIEV